MYVILGKNLNNMIETQYLLASYIYLAQLLEIIILISILKVIKYAILFITKHIEWHSAYNAVPTKSSEIVFLYVSEHVTKNLIIAFQFGPSLFLINGFVFSH